MKRMIASTIAVVALTLTSAVAGDYFLIHEDFDSSTVTSTGDTALVYWVRPTNSGSAIKTWGFVDDQVAGVTKSFGYFFANVPAGNHIFWSKAENVSSLEMEVVAGHTYYFEHDIRLGVMKAQVKQTVLDEADGKSAVNTCDHYELTEEGRGRGAEIAAQKYASIRSEGAKEDITRVAAVVPESTEGMVLIPQGLEVEVELMENMSSRHTTEGEEILFSTTHDLRINEELTIPQGRLVRGVVRRVDRASGGGDAGEIDVVLPALVTRDGTEIPVVGRVIVEGRDKHDQAGGMAAGFGLLGWGLTKGKAAYVLAGQRYVLSVREDTWVPDRSEEDREAKERAAQEERDASEVPAAACEITFKPQSGKSLNDLAVFIDAGEVLTEATLTAVGELTLLDPVKATRVKRRKGGWSAVTIPAWNVLRFVRPEGRTRFEVPIHFVGTLQDGTRVSATSTLFVTLLEGNQG